MKTFGLVLITLFIINSGGFAQPGNQSGAWMGGGHNFIANYGEMLELTDDQKRELIAIGMENRSERRFTQQQNRRDRGPALRGNRQNNRQGAVRGRGNQQRGGERWENRAELHNQILEVLTDGQKEKLEAVRAERIDSMVELRTLRHEVMIEKAGLEGDKAVKVNELLNVHAQSRAEFAGERDRERMLESREALHNELKEILTAAEYENLQQFMGQARQGNWNRNRAPGFRNR